VSRESLSRKSLRWLQLRRMLPLDSRDRSLRASISTWQEYIHALSLSLCRARGTKRGRRDRTRGCGDGTATARRRHDDGTTTARRRRDDGTATRSREVLIPRATATAAAPSNARTDVPCKSRDTPGSDPSTAPENTFAPDRETSATSFLPASVRWMSRRTRSPFVVSSRSRRGRAISRYRYGSRLNAVGIVIILSRFRDVSAMFPLPQTSSSSARDDRAIFLKNRSSSRLSDH